ncbi:methyltransferase, TIGR04325 family [Paraflavitalea pollutisoli]|uniref:methyltransferase, TIGR04325 family n=1 Tax=Paraflavitalea pollutisoli TaxID=3034143 RepID=UPI0023EC88A7|nr:methyltransferase, TIGR04325 family [Paraflavitalea sp. H1-2-19X]
MNWKEKLKSVIRRITQSSPWTGNYTSWEDALRHTSGYDAPAILEKVKEATLQVKRGDAVYERDSVLFDKIEYSWPLLANLLFVASRNKQSLKVVDFGGALGSSYFQNRSYLAHLKHLEWNVVEQENFVSAGRAHLQDSTLRFFYSVEEYLTLHGTPDVILLSCTLPYIERPYQLLEQLLSYNIPFLLIDSTYFNNVASDRLSVQKIPPAIYKASYPAWFLNYTRIKQLVEKNYSVHTEHQNDLFIVLDGVRIPYRGLLAERRQ